MPRIFSFLEYIPAQTTGETLPEKIQSYRYHHGLSQEQFAALLGVNESTVFHYEKGKHIPSKYTLQKLEKILSGTLQL